MALQKCRSGVPFSHEQFVAEPESCVVANVIAFTSIVNREINRFRLLTGGPSSLHCESQDSTEEARSSHKMLLLSMYKCGTGSSHINPFKEESRSFSALETYFPEGLQSPSLQFHKSLGGDPVFGDLQLDFWYVFRKHHRQMMNGGRWKGQLHISMKFG